MPEFISKLQHKTYEKGEYSDEKVRNLEETLLLIKTFPWDGQRGSDVQLTGPSVTIKDEYGNYLKIGLYFNDKFCLYYLDCDNHLFEYHAPDINDVLDIVTDFFNGQIALQKFEKHLFNIGNQAQFITNSFIYRVKPLRSLLLSGFFIVLFLLFFIPAIVLMSEKAPFFVFGIPFAFSLLFGGLLIYILKKYLACSTQIMQVSRGNPVFSFGNDVDDSTYNKNDIKEIIRYNPSGGRNPNMFVVFEIYFKDGSTIKFSNMLISDLIFNNKFPGSLITFGKKNPLWLI